MNRHDYAAYAALRDSARMDRGYRFAPAVPMPARMKRQNNGKLQFILATIIILFCALASGAV